MQVDKEAAAAEKARTDRAYEIVQELKRQKAEEAVLLYQPYTPQLKFHLMGSTCRERLFMAGNQLGKTYAGAAEASYHLTGIYPDWWEGRRFDYAITMLAGSETNELTRDGVQRLMCGEPADEAAFGSGMIPKHLIVSKSRKSGIIDAYDTVVVKHASGKNSTLKFKSYDQGRKKWQAATVDVVWFDEEPPIDVYSEGLTRITATKGLVFVTFTPLLGMSTVVCRYLNEGNENRDYVQMGIDDAEHIPEEERAAILEGYPEHERAARSVGTPMLGSGAIFPFAESSLSCDPFEIPRYWPMLCGMDFGIDHPTAACWLAWDRDSDTIYMTNEYCEPGGTAAVHAAAIKSRGPLIPVAWPHDGEQRGKETGSPLATYYRGTCGLNMLPKHANFQDDGSLSVERGLMEMRERMEQGRWKVFSTNVKWLEQCRMYHRDGGKIVKDKDDLIDASRYAMMMLNYAKTVDVLGRRGRKRRGHAKGLDFDLT